MTWIKCMCGEIFTSEERFEAHQTAVFERHIEIAGGTGDPPEEEN